MASLTLFTGWPLMLLMISPPVTPWRAGSEFGETFGTVVLAVVELV